MSSSGAERHAVGPGLQLRLALPDAARDTPAERLPAVDLSAIAGAQLTLRRGVEAGGLELRAICATAPSSRWAPGIEELVLDRASGLARATLGGGDARIERWEAGSIRAVGGHVEQPIEGERQSPSGVEVAAGGDTVTSSIRGRHVLGFAGEEHAVVLCTVICLEPGPPARCGALVDATSVEGTFVAAPEPSLLIRAILLAAEQPYPMAAAFALAASASIALLLARRPRRPLP